MRSSASTDAEEWAAELEEEWGESAESLEHIREVADEDEDDEFVLWSENQSAFDVFVQCKWIVAITPDGRRDYMGISAVEIKAACWLCGIPGPPGAELLKGVHICESTALPILNGRS